MGCVCVCSTLSCVCGGMGGRGCGVWGCVCREQVLKVLCILKVMISPGLLIWFKLEVVKLIKLLDDWV